MGGLSWRILLLLMALAMSATRSSRSMTSHDSPHNRHDKGSSNHGPRDDEVEDISLDPYIFTSTSLPTTDGEVNLRYMPSVGNGHLATNIYSDTIFVNGLYNGRLGISHRARIPAIHSTTFTQVTEDHTARVTYRVYAHHYYSRLLITDVIIERIGTGNDVITIEREGLQGEDSNSIDFEAEEVYECDVPDTQCHTRAGQIVESETDTSDKPWIFLYYTTIPDTFLLPADENEQSWTYIVSMDIDPGRAQADFDAGMGYILAGTTDELLELHTESWAEVWNKGRIETDGDLKLQKIINGCFYYLYSNLPSHSTSQQANQHYGLSPGGLANGHRGSDYYGHVFWDMETWMYPAILMFRPDLAREMLSYRINGMEPAFERAENGGYQGTRFPWESAYTGVEVTPFICVPCRENQQHITGDIAFAARQYISATRDVAWLQEEHTDSQYRGVDFIHQISHFWYTRPSYSFQKDRYEILGVMPPDEHHQEVNNSIYTNTVASLSIYFARYAACLAGEDEDEMVPERWLRVARELVFTYNREKRYHEEFEDFENMYWANETFPAGIKQADVVLLGFPLMWDMPPDVRHNDLVIYEELTYDDGPAMTWGMHCVGWLELGDNERAAELFRRSYELYVREPFKIWTEAQQGIGAINFITGMGGFLQAILFGYGGIRLHVEELNFLRPVLPPDVTRMKFHDLEYLGSSFDMEVNEDQVELVFTLLSNEIPLFVLQGEEEISVEQDQPILLNLEGFKIFTKLSSGCDLPYDIIDVDYSPIETTTAPWDAI